MSPKETARGAGGEEGLVVSCLRFSPHEYSPRVVFLSLGIEPVLTKRVSLEEYRVPFSEIASLMEV